MDKTASAAMPTARRGRLPGRNAYQEQKRRQTRAAILAAAADIFATSPYLYATIDDIIGAAKISRATFYLHFESKLSLAVAIYDAIAPDWFDHFDKLARLRSHDVKRLKKWITGLAKLYVDHGYVTPLVAQLETFEESFRTRLHRERDATIDRLARAGLQGFAAAIGDTTEALKQRARLQLLLQRLDQVCAMITRPGIAISPDADLYIEVVAEELRQCLVAE